MVAPVTNDLNSTTGHSTRLPLQTSLPVNGLSTTDLATILISLIAVEYIPIFLFSYYVRTHPLSNWTPMLVRFWYPAFIFLTFIAFLTVVITFGWKDAGRAISFEIRRNLVPWYAASVGLGVSAAFLATPFLRRILVIRYFLRAIADCPYCPRTIVFIVIMAFVMPAA